MTALPPNSLAAQGLSLPPIRGARRFRDVRADTTNDFAPQGPSIVNGGNNSYFEALWQSQDRTHIPYLINARRTHHPILEGLNRIQLAALGRYLVDNGGAAGYAVSLISNYSTPVIPQAASDDEDWNKENEDAFAEWCEVADFTGRFDFFTLQTLICNAIDTDGDIGAAVTLLNGVPQVRLYETFNIGALKGIHKGDGVRHDANGVVQGFDVIEGFHPRETERFLARNEMMLLYDPDRYCHYRGMSPFRRGGNDLRDANDIKGFTKLATKIASALAGVIKGASIEEDVWGDDSSPQEDGGSAPADDAKPSTKKLTRAELLGGDIPVIDGELQTLSHNNPGSNTVDFLGVLNGSFVSGLGLPPAFFLDEKLTGPNIRGVLSKAQKKFDRRIAMMARFVRFCWVRFIAWRIETGLTPNVPNWWKVHYQCPAKLVIDLGDQMSNEREDVLVGQMSRQERAGNSGKDWQRREDQITAEQRYIIQSCQKLAEETKVPLQTILTARGIIGAAKEEKSPKSKEGENQE